jgi:hypothetical protein
VNHFAVVQYPTGSLEIIELTTGSDPVAIAAALDVFLVGITASRARAEFILSQEQRKSEYRH